MGEIVAVVGQAGTGKTTWLMSKAKEFASKVITNPNQRLLVITRMHGARRRLEVTLRRSCPDIRYTISTIDSFALSMVNRWRTTFGFSKPVIAIQLDSNFMDTGLWVEAGFGNILSHAVQLLKSPTIGKVIGASYPLIMIDEFQDCHGIMLEFVKHLSRRSSMLLAADAFQFLNDKVEGCPAIEWIESLVSESKARIETLQCCHRTSNNAILYAAKCLRENRKSKDKTVSVISCPKPAMAAWKVTDALLFRFYTKNWDGNCAIISPSRDDYVTNVIDSCATQAQKRNRQPLKFQTEIAPDQHVKLVLKDIGFEEKRTQCIYSCDTSNPTGQQVIECVREQMRLRGLSDITEKIVVSYAERIVHRQRSYSPKEAKRLVITVHGAKNREFDNVIIIWPYRVREELKRQLLYNAITRARKHCMVLLQLTGKDAKSDSAISLLGPLEPFKDNSKKKKQRAKVQK
jgi:superfamily I DNA/RNA helicase